MFNLLPRDQKFFDQLESLAQHVVSTAQALMALIQSFPSFNGQLELIEQQRQSARVLNQESLARLDHAFITPLDREDILALLSDMYRVIDRLAELSQRFRLYPLADLHPSLVSQSRNMLELATEVERLIGCLRTRERLAIIANGGMNAVRKIEESVKSSREQFLRELFAGQPEPLEVIKKKELHDLLEDAIQRLDNVTQTLARVLLKNA